MTTDRKRKLNTFEAEKKISKARRLIPTAGYIRVSSDEQVKHGFSIEAQKAGLEKYAEENGYMIVEWYIDEGKSARGKTGKRKEYLRLIEDANAYPSGMLVTLGAVALCPYFTV